MSVIQGLEESNEEGKTAVWSDSEAEIEEKVIFSYSVTTALDDFDMDDKNAIAGIVARCREGQD